MKKYYALMLVIITIMLSGCGSNQPFKVEDTITQENGVFLSRTFKDESIKGSGSEEIKTFLSFKKGMKDVSEFAKKQNKHFVIVNYDINNLTGFPINNYNDLKSYCFKKDRDNSIRINCSSMKRMGKGAVEINFILVDNADYRIYSYNSDEVLESIKNEK